MVACCWNKSLLLGLMLFWRNIDQAGNVEVMVAWHAAVMCQDTSKCRT